MLTIAIAAHLPKLRNAIPKLLKLFEGYWPVAWAITARSSGSTAIALRDTYLQRYPVDGLAAFLLASEAHTSSTQHCLPAVDHGSNVAKSRIIALTLAITVDRCML